MSDSGKRCLEWSDLNGWIVNLLFDFQVWEILVKRVRKLDFWLDAFEEKSEIRTPYKLHLETCFGNLKYQVNVVKTSDFLG